VGGVGLLLAVATVLGRQGGVLQWVGSGVFRLGAQLVALLAWALAKILLRPLSWLVTSLHVNLRALRGAAQSLEGFRKTGAHATPGHGSMLNRVLGLLFFVALGVLLFRVLRRQRDSAERIRPSEFYEPQADATPFGWLRTRRRAKQRGQDLPADTVRRWYAQALLALQRRGLTKPPSKTPAEYLGDVNLSLPECAGEFTILTRAYEDVRYGNRHLDQEAIDRIEPHHLLLMETLRRAGKAP
jgi:hypothetical protein